MSPMNYWNLVGEEWAALQPQGCWRAYADARARDLVTRQLPRQNLGRVLKTDAFDEAVAAGLFPILKVRAKNVFGVDVSSKIIESACRRYPDFSVAAADVRALPFPDDQFDTVVSISTLDHFDSREDIVTAFKELYRVTARNGHLLVTIDNDANPVVWLRNRLPYGLLKRLRLVPYRVGKTYRSRALVRDVAACGFHVRSVSHVLHCPRALAVGICTMLDRFAGQSSWRRFHRILNSFEVLARLPSRSITGYFIAVLLEKPA